MLHIAVENWCVYVYRRRYYDRINQMLMIIQ